MLKNFDTFIILFHDAFKKNDRSCNLLFIHNFYLEISVSIFQKIILFVFTLINLTTKNKYAVTGVWNNSTPKVSQIYKKKKTSL